MAAQPAEGTIGAALDHAAATIGATGAMSARLDAEVLLAHVLGIGRAQLLAHRDRTLVARDCALFRDLVTRRARGEPVAYLVGHRSWYDLDLAVTPDVLVPRPETEGLLERALEWVRAHQVRAAVDVGTGSGALAIALARALPDAYVYATDVSQVALGVARANAARVAGAAGITFLQGDLLAPLPTRIDLVVANLPYIGEHEYVTLPRDVRLFEPRLALVGGAVGHELTARLLREAPAHLNAGGAIFAEIGPAQADGVVAAARTTCPDAALRLERDYAGLIRYLVVDTFGDEP